MTKQEANEEALIMDMFDNYLPQFGDVSIANSFDRKNLHKTFKTMYVFGDFLRPQFLKHNMQTSTEATVMVYPNLFYEAIVSHLCGGDICFKTLHGQVRTFVNPLGHTALCMYLRLQKRIQTERCADYAAHTYTPIQRDYIYVPGYDPIYVIAEIYHDNYTHESIEIQDVKRFQEYYKQVCILQKTQTPHVVTPPPQNAPQNQDKITGYPPGSFEKFKPPPSGIKEQSTKPTPKLPAALLNQIQQKPTPNTPLPPQKPAALLNQIQQKQNLKPKPNTPLPPKKPEESFLDQIKKGSFKLKKTTPTTKASETQKPPTESQDTYDYLKNSSLLDAVRNANKSDSDSDDSSVDFEAQLIKAGDVPKIRL